MKRIPGDWRVIIGSKHFHSSFFTIFAVTAVLYLLAGTVLTAQMIQGLEKTAHEQANRLSAAVQEVFSSAKSNAVFIGSMKSVEGLLSLSEPSMDDYIRMASDLSVCANMTYYESVDVFMENTQKVYVSQVGMYSYEDYPGTDLTALIQQDGATREAWLIGREYRRYYGDQYPSAVATYLHRLPVYTSDQNGCVAVHISLSALNKLIREKSAKTGWDVIVCYDEAPLYSSRSDFSAGQTGFLESARDYAQAGRFFFAASSDATAVQSVYLIPHRAVVSLLTPHLLTAAAIFLLLALAVALCAFAYSAVMLRPVQALMLRAGTPDSAEKGNEFELLGRAFDRLSGEIAGIRKQMERNLPLIQERLILELIGNYTEISDVREEYAQYGITFPHRRFAVVIAALPELEQIRGGPIKEQLKIVIRRRALERFSFLGTVYCAFGENESILFLINTGVSRELSPEVKKICEQLAQSLSDTVSLPLLFSGGVCRQGETVPYRAYVQARRGLSYADSAGESAVYFSARGEYTPSVDPKAVRQFVQCLLDRNLPSLRVQLDAYFKKYLTPAAGTDGARKLSCVLLSLVNAQLIELDAPADETRLAAALKKISAAQSADDCAAVLLAHYSALIGAHNKLPEESYAYVRDVTAFMEEHYRESLTIPQIAGHVSLNPVYLNKLFKLSTGKTVSEYLNSYRIERSKELLRSGELTVAAISEQIGYNDVRSFIRFFKKYIGVTPHEYRQQL